MKCPVGCFWCRISCWISCHQASTLQILVVQLINCLNLKYLVTHSLISEAWQEKWVSKFVTTAPFLKFKQDSLSSKFCRISSLNGMINFSPKWTNDQTKVTYEGNKGRINHQWVKNSLLSTQLKQLRNFEINDRTIPIATIKSSLQSKWLQMQTSIHRRAVVSFNTQPGEYGRKTKKL